MRDEAYDEARLDRLLDDPREERARPEPDVPAVKVKGHCRDCGAALIGRGDGPCRLGGPMQCPVYRDAMRS